MKIGGVQKSLLNLLKDLSRHNEVTLVLFADAGAYMDDIPSNVRIVSAGRLMRILGLSHKEAKRNGLKLCSYAFRILTKLIGFPLVLRFMLLFVKKIDGIYDVAVSYLQDSSKRKFYGGCNLYTIKKIKAEKYLTFIHSDYSKFGGAEKHNIKVISRFDNIALVSESCKKIFDNMVPHLSYKSMVVYNRVDSDDILSKANINSVKYDCSKIQLITVSRVTHEKGIDRLVEAFYEADRKIPDKMELHIVGDGKMFSTVNEMIIRYGLCDKVFMYGEQQNPYRYMKNADILVISSYHEAAPMVINEAYALNLKVLSTETSSAYEMIPENRGWVCENSKNGLSMALCDIAENFIKK